VSNLTLEWLQRIVKTGKLVPTVNQVAYPPPFSAALPGAATEPINHLSPPVDQPPPVQLRVVEGRFGVFGEARYRD
jgi:hypothetical protein